MPGGRPRKYKNADEMRAAVEAYFEECKEKGVFPDQAGMKLAIGLKDRMLAHYTSEKDNPESFQDYRDIFEDAKMEREHWLVQTMTSNYKAAQGCMNALKQPANGGYIDRPIDSGKVEITLKVAGIGGMEMFD